MTQTPAVNTGSRTPNPRWPYIFGALSVPLTLIWTIILIAALIERLTQGPAETGWSFLVASIFLGPPTLLVATFALLGLTITTGEGRTILGWITLASAVTPIGFTILTAIP